MTRHSNNDYEQLVTIFGIIISAVSAFISYKLNSDLLETFRSTIVTIAIVVVAGYSGKYFEINIWKIISIVSNIIWFTWHDTLQSVNDKIISDYNSTVQWGESIPPELIWYGQSWFIWFIQFLLVVCTIFIFYQQSSQY